MPAVTLFAGLLGKTARFARTSLLEVLGQPYARTACGKGVPRLGVLLHHVIPDAAVPLLMFLGIEIGLVLSDAVVTETIFAWPGVGRLLISAAAARDLPVAHADCALRAIGILAAMVLIALFAPLIAPYDFAQQNLLKWLRPPVFWDGEWSYPLGTDNLGHDILSRLIYGIRTSIAVALVGTQP